MDGNAVVLSLYGARLRQTHAAATPGGASSNFLHKSDLVQLLRSRFLIHWMWYKHRSTSVDIAHIRFQTCLSATAVCIAFCRRG